MKTASIIYFLLIAVIITTLTGCVPGGGAYHQDNPAGFFSGIWHGWIAPVSLIISLFNGSIRIYEANNTGFLYDLGFYMAIISGFGGLSLTRKKIKSNKEKSASLK
jgi:hypothetical protein